MLDIEKSKKFIELFIFEFKKVYPSVVIGYQYDENLGFFDICHNNKILQFESKEFLNNVGNLIKEILYSNGIFNISFNYDYSKDSNCIIEDTIIDAISNLTFKYSDSLKSYSFIKEVNIFMSDINVDRVAGNSNLFINSKYNFFINEINDLCKNKFYREKNMDKLEEGLAA